MKLPTPAEQSITQPSRAYKKVTTQEVGGDGSQGVYRQTVGVSSHKIDFSSIDTEELPCQHEQVITSEKAVQYSSLSSLPSSKAPMASSQAKPDDGVIIRNESVDHIVRRFKTIIDIQTDSPKEAKGCIKSSISIDCLREHAASRDTVSIQSAPLDRGNKLTISISNDSLNSDTDMKRSEASLGSVGKEILEKTRALSSAPQLEDVRNLNEISSGENRVTSEAPSVPVSRPMTPEHLLSIDQNTHVTGVDGQWKIVVAIDFGTTYSGYAFAFTQRPSRIYVMRRWQHGDPGMRDSKIPTALLLQPNGKFHSFGFEARNKYHTLDHDQSRHWLYFQNFKTLLYSSPQKRLPLNENTQIEAASGVQVNALVVFAYVLRFFRQHSLVEIKSLWSKMYPDSELPITNIRWVVTVPAIWSQPAKQFMRRAAYLAEIASDSQPDQLIIALEPEAASVFIRSLRLVDLPPQFPGSSLTDKVRPNSPTSSYLYFTQNSTVEIPVELLLHNRRRKRNRTRSPNQGRNSSASMNRVDSDDSDTQLAVFDENNSEAICLRETVGHSLGVGSRYLVADCGGGTVDITVHELVSGGIKELYKASGSNYGSLAVNEEFMKLLRLIFRDEFISSFQQRRPAGFLDLMAAFESRKRAASPWKMNSLNVAMPFNFLDLYQRTYNETVDKALRRLLLLEDVPPDQGVPPDLGDLSEAAKMGSLNPVSQGDVSWSSCGGLLRLYPAMVKRLFQPVLNTITRNIEHVISQPQCSGVDRMFIVGGFAESPMLQNELRVRFGESYSIIIPPEPSLAVLRGAVAFGLDPGIVQVRRSQLTYGIGALHRFNPKKHPRSKRILRFGTYWCTDVFDKFVTVDQPICDGDIVVRRYSPVAPRQEAAIVKLYASPHTDSAYLTDEDVYLCGVLKLDLSPLHQSEDNRGCKREIQIRMSFGGTEIECVAVDVATRSAVSVKLDFLAKPEDEFKLLAQSQQQHSAVDSDSDSKASENKQKRPKFTDNFV